MDSHSFFQNKAKNIIPELDQTVSMSVLINHVENFLNFKGQNSFISVLLSPTKQIILLRVKFFDNKKYTIISLKRDYGTNVDYL